MDIDHNAQNWHDGASLATSRAATGDIIVEGKMIEANRGSVWPATPCFGPGHSVDAPARRS
jgi:hypothetical protein